MKKFQLRKLVRDKIPSHMLASGQFIEELRELDDEEFIKELQRKVVEEALELGSAENMEAIKEELADVLEVLNYLQKALELNDDDIAKFQQKKASKNGAFDKRLYIDSVSVEEGSDWDQYYSQKPEVFPEVA